jgi:hypothetical protein
MAESLEHRGFGHLVEDDALDVDAFERMALAQHLLDMPGDRLALAIGVGGQI